MVDAGTTVEQWRAVAELAARDASADMLAYARWMREIADVMPAGRARESFTDLAGSLADQAGVYWAAAICYGDGRIDADTAARIAGDTAGR